MNEDIQIACRAAETGLITVVQLAEVLRDAWLDSSRPDYVWQALIARGYLDIAEIEALRASNGQGRSSPKDAQELLPAAAHRYVVEKRLGAGGMGVVTQVQDTSLGRSVARKQLHPNQIGEPEPVGALLTEARVAGSLEHPNIIPIYDVGFMPSGEPYYTMRLMDQMSLDDVLVMLRGGNPEAAREFPLVRLLRIFQQVCQAVDYAHSRQVVHRDIKPDNIRLGRYGEVQVADWGLARVAGMPDLALQKALDEARARGDTDPCIVIGSPNYMSPEQACGLNDQVGPQSDIYSLGCVLYEILTLEVPFDDVDTMVLLDRVELDDIVPPTEKAPDRVIPAELERICMAALAKDMDERIQDVRVLWRRVDEYVQGYRERERAGNAAFEQVQRGHRFGDAYSRLCEARGRLETRLEAATDPASSRQLRRDLDALDLEIITTWGEAYDAYTRALGYSPDDLVARAKLSELAWLRLLDAESASDPISCQFFWNMLRHHNDGSYDRFIVGEATATVHSQPEGATIYVRSYAEPTFEDGGVPERAVGRTPLVLVELPAGLYLVTAELAGHETASVPVFLRAGQEPTLDIQLHEA